MGSMGMESVAEGVGRPRRLRRLLWVLGSMGWDNSLSEMGSLRTSMLRTGSRRLLRNCFTTQYDFGKIHITTQSLTKVVSQRGEGAAGNKGKDKEISKLGGKTTLASILKKGVSLAGGIKAQSLTIRTDMKSSTSLRDLRAGSEGAIVGGVVLPGGQQVFVGGNNQAGFVGCCSDFVGSFSCTWEFLTQIDQVILHNKWFFGTSSKCVWNIGRFGTLV